MDIHQVSGLSQTQPHPLLPTLPLPSGLTTLNLLCIQIILLLLLFLPQALCQSGAGHTETGWHSGPLGNGDWLREEAEFSEAPVEGGGIGGIHTGSQFQRLRLEESADQPVLCV